MANNISAKKQKRTRRIGTYLMLIGMFLICLSLVLVMYNLYDDYRAAGYSSQVLSQMPGFDLAAAESADQELDGPSVYELYPDMDLPTMEIDGHEYIGRLDIPALELALPVQLDWDYTALQLSPCRYYGSAYQKNMIICAHNYESHFGKLKYLSPGDRIYFTDAEENVFVYEVVALEQLQPTALDEIKEGDYALTLFTCTIGGAYRVTVRCNEV